MHFQVKWTVRLDYVICLFYTQFEFSWRVGEKGVVKFIWCSSDSILLCVKIVLLVFIFRFQLNEEKVAIKCTSLKNRIEILH